MCKVCKCGREPGREPPVAWPWWLSVQCMFHSGDIHLVRCRPTEASAASSCRNTLWCNSDIRLSVHGATQEPSAFIFDRTQQHRLLGCTLDQTCRSPLHQKDCRQLVMKRLFLFYACV